MKYCEKCGAQPTRGANYCGNCGAVVTIALNNPTSQILTPLPNLQMNREADLINTVDKKQMSRNSRITVFFFGALMFWVGVKPMMVPIDSLPETQYSDYYLVFVLVSFWTIGYFLIYSAWRGIPKYIK